MQPPSSWIPLVVPALLAVLLLRWIVELILARLNEHAALAHAHDIPADFRAIMDAETYAQSVHYTCARSRFGQFEGTFQTGLLAILLLGGLLPLGFHRGTTVLGESAAAVALVILTMLGFLWVLRLPFDWAAQFGLEERFGFNTNTPRNWWLDQLKGAALGFLIGFPLLWLIVSLPAHAGAAWWVYAWLALLGCQCLLLFIAPVLILPWFNRFTPLPEGSLRDRLEGLARQTRFQHRDILVMDGSRRSRHLNAFFTGLGRFRRIVLYDTLLAQLQDDELEAVLAHEIGHYRLGHLPRLLAASALGSSLLFFLCGQLSAEGWLFEAFGFQAAGIGPLLLLLLVFGGAFSFWLSPLANSWSRRFEYQADRFAAQCAGGAGPLVRALRKLTRRNLGNLTPHPAYSWFYYSHPTLWEREKALAVCAPPAVSVAEKPDTTAGR